MLLFRASGRERLVRRGRIAVCRNKFALGLGFAGKRHCHRRRRLAAPLSWINRPNRSWVWPTAGWLAILAGVFIYASSTSAEIGIVYGLLILAVVTTAPLPPRLSSGAINFAPHCRPPSNPKIVRRIGGEPLPRVSGDRARGHCRYRSRRRICCRHAPRGPRPCHHRGNSCSCVMGRRHGVDAG